MQTPGSPHLPPTFDLAREQLSVRPMGALTLQLRHFRLALQGAAAALDVVQPIAADLCVGPYADLPDADVPLSADQLARWGVTLPQVLDAAVVAGFGRPVPAAQRVESVHLFQDVRFAGTALLRPELVRGLPVDGDPVVLVPTVGDLLVGGSQDPVGLTFLARMADRLIQSPALPVSIQPVTLRGPGWVSFAWPEAAQPFADALRRRWDTLSYARQRPLLQQHYERVGPPTAVPEVGLYERDGATVTVTSLTEGVPAVLPMADLVSLVRTAGAATPVPMDRLRAVPGLLVPVPGTAPPRVYATRFPIELTR
ncbi:hypothetical protein [Nakamurella sp.]|uniref:hypothetical protein n=1 Tax=Nakamurella sp. TaxID=1869182 RepID=UPI003B3B4E0C